MNNINFIYIIILTVIIITTLYLGWLLTETKCRIADKHWLFNRKPFSCRPCLTFHFGWILSALVAFIINSIPFFIGGAILSFLVWLILEIENRSKIDK